MGLRRARAEPGCRTCHRAGQASIIGPLAKWLGDALEWHPLSANLIPRIGQAGRAVPEAVASEGGSMSVLGMLVLGAIALVGAILLLGGSAARGVLPVVLGALATAVLGAAPPPALTLIRAGVLIDGASAEPRRDQ